MNAWVPLLLSDPSACLRLKVLRELLQRPEEDAEVIELMALRESDKLVTELVQLQQGDGSWQAGTLKGSAGFPPLMVTAQALARLGYLGFDAGYPLVARGADYLFSQQCQDGSWPLALRNAMPETRSGKYDRIPLQTALPLLGLAACGYAADQRAELAYEWLLAQRLPDGAFPTGYAGGVLGGVAGYRRLPHSRWGCRSNTTGALYCLALHPRRRHGEAARRALDLLLGRETREHAMLGYETARLVGAEPVRGFLTRFAYFDPALILNFCWRVGVTLEDPRLRDLAAFIREQQGSYGLWTYAPQPQVSRWVTFDLLRSLARIDRDGDWVSLEPRTPFQAYLKKSRRY